MRNFCWCLGPQVGTVLRHSWFASAYVHQELKEEGGVEGRRDGGGKKGNREKERERDEERVILLKVTSHQSNCTFKCKIITVFLMRPGKEYECMINYAKLTEDTVQKRLKDLKKN